MLELQNPISAHFELILGYLARFLSIQEKYEIDPLSIDFTTHPTKNTTISSILYQELLAGNFSSIHQISLLSGLNWHTMCLNITVFHEVFHSYALICDNIQMFSHQIHSYLIKSDYIFGFYHILFDSIGL